MSRGRKSPDWDAALDVGSATRNLAIEHEGDWFKDPWRWPEVVWLASRTGSHHLIERLNGASLFLGCPIDVPKENFAIRPAAIINPVDRLAYQALVDRFSVDLSGHLPDFVCGWRLPRDDPTQGLYAANSNEWSNYRQHLTEFSEGFSYGLSTDVVGFFAHIEPDRLCDHIEMLCGGGRVLTRLLQYVLGWKAVLDRSGLPQRSLASSLLANSYVRSIDELLSAQSSRIGRRTRRDALSAVRWMDDIWLFGDDESALRGAQLELDASLRSLGLTLNAGKTRLLEGDDLIAEARQREHSAVDADLSRTRGRTTESLEDLVAHLHQSPETSNRTSFRFVLARARQHSVEPLLEPLYEVLHRAPHAADGLADSLRTSGRWRDLQDWYLEYRSSSWAVDLAVAHFGRMFPAKPRPKRKVMDVFEEDCMSPSLPIATTALVRLCCWDNARTRGAIREASKTAAHPLMRRALALTGLAAAEDRAIIRRLLRSHADNQALLSLVEETGFRPIPVESSF